MSERAPDAATDEGARRVALTPDAIVAALEAVFDEVIEQQAAKVLRIANEVHPGLTKDDVMQPHDFADLNRDPIFNFEDGILAGIKAARHALRSRVYREMGWRGLARPKATDPSGVAPLPRDE